MITGFGCRKMHTSQRLLTSGRQLHFLKETDRDKPFVFLSVALGSSWHLLTPDAQLYENTVVEHERCYRVPVSIQLFSRMINSILRDGMVLSQGQQLAIGMDCGLHMANSD